MKSISKLFSFFLAFGFIALFFYWWIRLFQSPLQEDDPYYFYGDSQYRGEDGEPIQYETEEEEDQNQALKENQHIPAGYSQLAN